jgi:hypothetical protein
VDATAVFFGACRKGLLGPVKGTSLCISFLLVLVSAAAAALCPPHLLTAAPPLYALFVWLISHQPTVLFSQNKSATSNQPAILFSQNKSAPAKRTGCYSPDLFCWIGVGSILGL